jgi:hypothetical protein
MLKSRFSNERVNEIRSRQHTALFLIAIFSAVILILSLVQNSQILLVLLLYACILLEGISIAVYVWASRNDLEDRPTDPNAERVEPRGTDVVSNMRVYVTFAAKGSEHSRREIAFILRNLIEEGRLGEKALLPNDSGFQADLQRVISRYVGTYEEENPVKNTSREEREAYVSSLERIIQKLEST